MKVSLADTASFSELAQAANDVAAVNLCTAATLAWLVYDIIITIDQEVLLLRSGLTWTKGICVFLRYYTVIMLSLFLAGNLSSTISPQFCQFFIWLRGIPSVVLIKQTSDCLFVIRIGALYAWNKPVIGFSVFMWLVTISAIVTTTILETSKTSVIPRPPGILIPGCLATLPPNAGIAVIPTSIALVTSLVFFLLTFYKFLSVVGNPGLPKSQYLRIFSRIAPTMHLFFRDSAIYFMMALALNVLSAVFLIALKHRAIELMNGAWMMAGHAVITSRMVLNLHGIMNKNQSMQRTKQSTLLFAHSVTKTFESV